MADAPDPAGVAAAILIVEDHDLVRAALRDWLRGLFPDYRVWEASTAEEALLLAAAQRPRIVVMDISLPGLSGIEATRSIKRLRPPIPVVIVSIHEEPHYQAEARAAGADAYVFKRDMDTQLVPLLQGLLARGAPAGVTYDTAGTSTALGD